MFYKGIILQCPATTQEHWNKYDELSDRLVDDFKINNASTIKQIHSLEYLARTILAKSSPEERPFVSVSTLLRIFKGDKTLKDGGEVMWWWSVSILALIKFGIIKEDDKNGVHWKNEINGIPYTINHISLIGPMFDRNKRLDNPETKEQFEKNKLCYVCFTRTKYRCQGCKAKYCSVECQDSHWTQHKSMCKKGCY